MQGNPSIPIPHTLLREPRRQNRRKIVLCSQQDKDAKIHEALDHLTVGNALAPARKVALGVLLDVAFVEFFRDELHVVYEFEVWPDENAREVEPITPLAVEVGMSKNSRVAQEFEKGWEGRDTLRGLPFVEILVKGLVGPLQKPDGAPEQACDHHTRSTQTSSTSWSAPSGDQ